MKKIIISLVLISLLFVGSIYAKAATIDEIVESLKKSELMSYYEDAEIKYENDVLKILYTSYDDEKYVYEFPCKDNVLEYSTGDISTYKEANEKIGATMWISSILNTTLRLNGFTDEEITEFNKKSPGEVNLLDDGIEFSYSDEQETFEEDGSSITITPFSIKINFETAKIDKISKINVLHYVLVGAGALILAGGTLFFIKKKIGK